MNSIWVSLKDIIDPGEYGGMITLAVMILLLAWIMSAITTRLLYINKGIPASIKKRFDKTFVLYVIRIKNLIIFITAFLIYTNLIPAFNSFLPTIMAGTGIVALALGFAAGSTIANLIAGLSLAVFRPVRIGDKVGINGEYSTVEDITLRHTIVRSLQNRRKVIPNLQLDEMTLINYSIIDPAMLCTVDIGVSYDTDIDLARRLILEEMEHCPFLDQTSDAPLVRVVSHGDFAIVLRLYVRVSNPDEVRFTRFWLLEKIKRRFDREGVEIPFPYKTFINKKDFSCYGNSNS